MEATGGTVQMDSFLKTRRCWWPVINKSTSEGSSVTKFSFIGQTLGIYRYKKYKNGISRGSFSTLYLTLIAVTLIELLFLESILLCRLK